MQDFHMSVIYSYANIRILSLHFWHQIGFFNSFGSICFEYFRINWMFIPSLSLLVGALMFELVWMSGLLFKCSRTRCLWFSLCTDFVNSINVRTDSLVVIDEQYGVNVKHQEYFADSPSTGMDPASRDEWALGWIYTQFVFEVLWYVSVVKEVQNNYAI